MRDCAGARAPAPVKRRDAGIVVLAVAVMPVVGRTQTARKVYRIGFLGLSSPSDYAPYLDAFLLGLRELGYEEGRNMVIEYRWADGREERLPDLASQLVRSNPDLLVTHAIGVNVAQTVTSTIPIVMGVSADPVGFGLVKSLARPGGNITGVASQLADLSAKRLELLKEAVPHLKDVAVLSNLALPAARKGLDETAAAARKLGVRLRSFGVVADAAQLELTFAAIAAERTDGLIVQPDPVTGKHGAAISAFAIKHRLPAIGGGKYFATDGGLLSYGGNFVEGWRLAARYVDKVLKGAKPGELPIEQPTTFELVINLKTAKALGLALPAGLTLRATEVIQ